MAMSSNAAASNSLGFAHAVKALGFQYSVKHTFLEFTDFDGTPFLSMDSDETCDIALPKKRTRSSSLPPLSFSTSAFGSAKKDDVLCPSSPRSTAIGESDSQLPSLDLATIASDDSWSSPGSDNFSISTPAFESKSFFDLATLEDNAELTLRQHNAGGCTPCFYMDSPAGCLSGSDCKFCHHAHVKSFRGRPSKFQRKSIQDIVAMLFSSFSTDSEEFRAAVECLASRSSYMSVVISRYSQSVNLPDDVPHNLVSTSVATGRAGWTLEERAKLGLQFGNAALSLIFDNYQSSGAKQRNQILLENAMEGVVF